LKGLGKVVENIRVARVSPPHSICSNFIMEKMMIPSAYNFMVAIRTVVVVGMFKVS
jgi:hypothetical protein